jgi:hypothetical protein
VNAHEQRVAMQIADLLMLEPTEEAAIVIAEALRLKAERMKVRRDRERAAARPSDLSGCEQKPVVSEDEP